MTGGKEIWSTEIVNLAKDTDLLKPLKRQDRGMRNTIRRVWRWRKRLKNKREIAIRLLH
jgi:hypothetical protein